MGVAFERTMLYRQFHAGRAEACSLTGGQKSEVRKTAVEVRIRGTINAD